MTSHPITGHTRVYAHFADPVAHVRTPEVMNRFFRQRGIDAVVVPYQVGVEDLPQAVAAARSWKNLAGIGVTMPHKEHIAGLLDDLTEDAVRAGASNVIRRLPDGRLLGGQYDGPGLVAGLLAHGVRLEGARVLLLGAGGSARAVAMALAAVGVSRLDIRNRTTARAVELAERVSGVHPAVRCEVREENTVAGVDVLVNTTSVGMRGTDPLPVDLTALTAATAVSDIIMKPTRTRLLDHAQRAGCPVVPGIHMLLNQLGPTADFLGLTPTLEPSGEPDPPELTDPLAHASDAAEVA
ncbi:shikimate dehydrogenase family protein [Actinacidiphila alni]|uniref:shikimate dehydrogenase family protein n=1 Tax=Actinacidiphila alni TaxID=380248 RepID=UPI003455F491